MTGFDGSGCGVCVSVLFTVVVVAAAVAYIPHSRTLTAQTVAGTHIKKRTHAYTQASIFLFTRGTNNVNARV